MIRWVPVWCSVVLLSSLAIAQDTAAGEAQARALAAEAMAALAGNASLTDVTLTGTVTRTAGSDVQSGTVNLQATATGSSQVRLGLTSGERTELRAAPGGVTKGQWSGPNGAPHAAAGQNLWSDAAWFLPAFSSLAHNGDSKYGFSYVGEERRAGATVQHVRVWQLWPGPGKDMLNLPRLSALDFYLDSATHLPQAVAFKVHPENNMLVNIPAEVRFSDYRSVNGVQVPFHVQRLLNGSVELDITVSDAVFNSGVSAPQLAE